LGRKNPDKSLRAVKVASIEKLVEQRNTEKAEQNLVMKKKIENFVTHRIPWNPCGPVSLTRNARKTHFCRLIRRTSNEQRKFENLLEANLYPAGAVILGENPPFLNIKSLIFLRMSTI
jgi:hypothetical protein